MTKVEKRIEELKGRNIFLVAGLAGEAIPEGSAAEALIFSAFLDEYSREVLIDIREALKTYEISRNARAALTRARIRFQGTDGIRGKVDASPCEDYLRRFVGEHVVTPSLIENNCYSFAEILLSRGILSPGDAVLVGEDGRDLFAARALSRAMKDGFARAGCVVHDLGLAPTPEVPYQMLTCGIRAGAALTASHNPANQNGLKFFLDGKKLLPEGDVGDYTLSAHQYGNSLTPLPCAPPTSVRTVPPAQRERFIDFIADSLPPAKASLGEVRIVCDPANGAMSAIAPAVLTKLGADFRMVNAEPTGDNINQGGGVAELEGTDRIEGRVERDVFAGYLPSIRATFEEGRSASKPVFGIVFDGDGDRGYVLAYDRGEDALWVIDGDRGGFVIARHLARCDPAASEMFFLSTVESDLMTNYYVEERIGCRTEICPVGDKWLGAFGGGPVLLAEESSGHVIIPSPVPTLDGGRAILMTGDGLQATLFLLCCALDEGLTAEDLSHPFPPGVGRTAYVYNVDRSLLAKGSAVWNADADALKAKLAELKAEGALDSACELRFVEKPEDPDMLFAALVDDDGRVVGTVFARNSGTEVKTAAYYRGRADLEAPLSELAACINRNHMSMMKDRSSPEFRMEQAIMDAIAERGPIPESQMASIVEDALGAVPSPPALRSVLYGLRKEGRMGAPGERDAPPEG